VRMKKYNHNIPSIQDKVKDMPHVYYFNLDHDVDRREHMEEQFNRYGIVYTRVSQNNYLVDQFDSWKSRIDDLYTFEIISNAVKKQYNSNLYAHVANTFAHLDLFDWWIKNTDDENLIVMEDDYDLSLIEDWHFTWGYLMNSIPYDWDAIQFSYTYSYPMPFFLHPRRQDQTGFGAMLLNRHYVNKLLNILLNDDGQLIVKSVSGIHSSKPCKLLYKTCSPDICFGATGVTYRIPLIDEQIFDRRSTSIKKWWKTKRDEFSLEDFFTYGKPYDNEMMIVDNKNAFSYS